MMFRSFRVNFGILTGRRISRPEIPGPRGCLAIRMKPCKSATGFMKFPGLPGMICFFGNNPRRRPHFRLGKYQNFTQMCEDLDMPRLPTTRIDGKRYQNYVIHYTFCWYLEGIGVGVLSVWFRCCVVCALILGKLMIAWFQGIGINYDKL